MVFNAYLFKNIAFVTVITAIVLVALIFLSQSLRFLELIIGSGASSVTFWILTLLALPRFLEIILPIALMISTVFIYNRMLADSEITVMRTAGYSPLSLSQAPLLLALICTIFLLFVTTWLSPITLSNMQNMQNVIKAQYSLLLFREGVFNTIGKDLTVYIRDKRSDGELRGLIIHDSRDELDNSVTIFAKRGVILDDGDVQKVFVYDGARQDFNPETGALNRLEFEQYSVDLPESGPVRTRWREPDERTFFELLNPDLNVQRDVQNIYTFQVEAHRRIVSPILSLTFVSMSLVCMLVGPFSRRGQHWRVSIAILLSVLVQGLYLGAFNLAAQSYFGLILMYLFAFLPLGVSVFLLSSWGEALRYRIFYTASST